MADRIFLRLSERWALGADDLQWILYKPRREETPSELSSRSWFPVAFVSSHKRHLLRHIRENRPQDEDTAASALASYPDTFGEWQALEAEAATSGNASSDPGVPG
jgi:hypothetical protein